MSVLKGKLQKRKWLMVAIMPCFTTQTFIGSHQHSVTPSWPHVELLLKQGKLMLAFCPFHHTLAQRWAWLETCLFSANSMLINRMEVMSKFMRQIKNPCSGINTNLKKTVGK